MATLDEVLKKVDAVVKRFDAMVARRKDTAARKAKKQVPWTAETLKNRVIARKRKHDLGWVTMLKTSERPKQFRPEDPRPSFRTTGDPSLAPSYWRDDD